MIPFSPEVFFALFEEYNLAIWPAQLVAYGLGLLVLVLAIRPSPMSSTLIGVILAAFWLWNGIAYHWLFFAPINFAAPVFAGLFVLQAVLLLWKCTIRRNVTFAFRRDAISVAGLTLMVSALTIYPLLAIASGHEWPQFAVFGVAPTPTVIFSFGVLMFVRPRASLTLLIIPVLWALITGIVLWSVGIPEDALLPVAALVAMALIVRQRRKPA